MVKGKEFDFKCVEQHHPRVQQVNPGHSAPQLLPMARLSRTLHPHLFNVSPPFPQCECSVFISIPAPKIFHFLPPRSHCVPLPHTVANHHVAIFYFSFSLAASLFLSGRCHLAVAKVYLKAVHSIQSPGFHPFSL